MRGVSSVMDREKLLEFLTTTLSDVEYQIEVIRRSHFRNATWGEPHDVHLMRDSQGNYILVPLLVAKSQLLVAIAELLTQEK